MPSNHRLRRGRHDHDVHVDLTTFIDPLILLVAVLMLIMPEVSRLRGHEIPVQNTDSGEATNVTADTRLIAFDANGQITVDDQKFSEQQLTAWLRQLPEKTAVMLAGHSEASYADGLRIRLLIQECGVNVRELSQQR